MSFKQRWARGAAAVAVGALVLGLAACGGGGGQVEPFVPNRILAFGDEMSVIQPDGRKYTINALKADNVTIDCVAHPLWIQVVATSFNLKFQECPEGATAPTSRILATPGAKAADIKTQVDSVAASLTKKELATMLVGVNDILELYAQYPARSEADITAELKNRGKAWGVQINRVAQLGPAVLVATAPDLGVTPFGLAEKADPAKQGIDRAALLTRLGNAFNGAMRLEIINDGRLIGLVFTDLEIQNVVRFPAAFGFANVTEAACLASAPLPNCSTQTLVAGSGSGTGGAAPTATSWLWADAVQLSAGGQQRLGLIASTRAHNNPF